MTLSLVLSRKQETVFFTETLNNTFENPGKPRSGPAAWKRSLTHTCVWTSFLRTEWVWWGKGFMELVWEERLRRWRTGWARRINHYLYTCHTSPLTPTVNTFIGAGGGWTQNSARQQHRHRQSVLWVESKIHATFIELHLFSLIRVESWSGFTNRIPV